MSHHAIVTTLLRQRRRDLALAYVRHYVHAKRGLFYHGTSSVFAKRILSEGFVPDPKKKIWDGETGTSASYTGTYFTAWPHTAGRYAAGAVRKFGGFEVIFEVQLETKTGVFDEDEVAPLALSVIMTVSERKPGEWLNSHVADRILNDKRELAAVVDTAVMKWIGTGEETSPRAMPFAYLYRQRYGETPIHPKYMAAVYGAAKQSVLAFLEDVRDTNSTDGNGPRYRKAETNLFRAINLSRYGPQQKGGPHNIRMVEPVGFRGTNKIVAAIGDQWQMPMGDQPRIRTVHILYGKPSAELLKSRHDEKVVIKRGWPKPESKQALVATKFDERMDELFRDQAKQRRKKIGIDGDRNVTDQIEVSQSVPGRVWSFWFKASGMEIVQVNGLKRARAMRSVLRDSGLRDFRKLRELAFEWRKQNPR